MSHLDRLASSYEVSRIGEIGWGHAVNSRGRLMHFLADPEAMILESDVIISHGLDIESHPSFPSLLSTPEVEARPHQPESDLSLRSFIETTIPTGKGIKLDFKAPLAVAQALALLNELKPRQLVLLNADILTGPDGGRSLFSPATFIDQCQRNYPSGILSVGWTTSVHHIREDPAPYSPEMVREMIELTSELSEVTFPVRAGLLRESWDNLRPLLERDGRSLTVWSGEAPSLELLDWLRAETDPTRTFYDLLDQHHDPVRLFTA